MKPAHLFCLLLIISFSSPAEEGMWQPHQLAELKKELKSLGLKLNPENMKNLTEFPMGAVISLGGCSASFVSDQGLVITNHHCAYGSLQYNSKKENNILENGFLAKSLNEELSATPGSRVYVTEESINITDKIVGGLDAESDGYQRYKSIEQNKKKAIAECEQNKDYRCRVINFHGGMEYFLFKQLMIRDVRLVHAPAKAIGKYGGDIDNWMWPRHTGDYAFYRAYVGKDGKPADFSADNVPYKPKHYLRVNAKGVDKGDYVMIIGYPGGTNRYRTASEVFNQFTWLYPRAKAYREEFIAVIKKTAPKGSEARIKYENELAGLANYAKNYGSMIESYQKSDFQQRVSRLESKLAAWVNADDDRKKKFGSTIDNLNKLIMQNLKYQQRDLVMNYLGRAKLMKAARHLYRLANEKQKPDIEREPGYQDRDLNQFKQASVRLNRRYDANVDKAVLLHFIKHYAKLPDDQHIAEFDKFFNLDNGFNEKKLIKKLDKIYKNSKLNEKEVRLSWMDKSVNDFKASNDPFIQFAVTMYDSDIAIERDEKTLNGNFLLIRPQYMQAIIEYYRGLDKPIYADANSSLRISYGTVKGYSPRDGVYSQPFTSLNGILQKDTGEEPFNSPQKQLDLIKQHDYGRYMKTGFNSVPVNFLSTLDVTGGNSGSPTLNGKGELVGLVFDGVYESIIADWDYNDILNRSIHVDIRYMLWVMKYIDGANNLLEEMNIIH